MQLTLSRTNFFTVVTGAFALMGISCEPKEKLVYVEVPVEVEKLVEVEPTTTNQKDPDGSSGGSSDTTIHLAGTLVIPGLDGGASGLGHVATSPPYALNCVTLDEDAKSARIETLATSNGHSFTGDLQGFVGRSFGCFLLENTTVLSPIVFGADGASLFAGAGDLAFDLTYNRADKSAEAVIDRGASTSLQAEALEKARKSNEVADTDLSSFTGTYQITCDDKEQGLVCVPELLPAEQIYFSHFKLGSRDHMALWESEARREVCVPESATEAKPRFNMRLGAFQADLNFTSSSGFLNSLDAAYTAMRSEDSESLPRQLADLIWDQAKEHSTHYEQECTQSVFDHNNGYCKLVLGEVEHHSWYDELNDITHTYSHPRWYMFSEWDTLATYSESVETKHLPCRDRWDPVLDVCPLGTPVDENGEGSYPAYFGKAGGQDRRLRLVCTDSGGSSITFQDWAHGNSLEAASAEASARRGCNKITNALSAFDDEYEFFREEVRRQITHIAALPIQGQQHHLCRGRMLPAAFSFSDCQSSAVLHEIGQRSYVYWERHKPSWLTTDLEQDAQANGFEWVSEWSKDWSRAEYCADLQHDLDQIGMKLNVASDKVMEGDGAALSWYPDSGLCPAHATGGRALFNPADCRAEFLAKDEERQIIALQRRRIGPWNPLAYLACPDPTVRSELYDSAKSQCLPQAYMVGMCDNSGNCTERMRCAGTQGGRCYDEFGNFRGVIPGRLAVTRARAGVNGAFSLTDTNRDQWLDWDAEAGKMKSCRLNNESVFTSQARKSGDATAYLKQKIEQRCELMDDNDTTDLQGNDPAGMGGEAPSQDLPNMDVMMKLNLKRL